MVHQAQFREETNPRDHAETSSDDPEGAGKTPEDERSRSAAQHSFEAAQTPVAL